MRCALARWLGAVALTRTGDAAELVALGWAVYAASSSATSVGVLTMARLLPLVVAAPLAGRLADDHDAARVWQWIMVAATGFTAVLTYAVATRAPMGGLIALVAARSVVVAGEPMLRQLVVTHLFGPRRLTSVLATQSVVLTLSSAVGPALATPVLATAGPWPVIAANALSYPLALLLCGTGRSGGGSSSPRSADPDPRPRLGQVVREHPRVAGQLVLAVGPMLFGFPYTALLPVIAGQGLRSGAATAGILAGTGAAGAVAAALFLIWRAPASPAPWAGVAAGGLAVALAGLAVSLGVRRTGLAIAAMAVVGATGQLYRTTNRAALLAEVPPAVRGSVLGWASTDRVLIPLGAAGLAVLAQWWGTVWMTTVMALGCAAAVGVSLLSRRLLRRAAQRHLPA